MTPRTGEASRRRRRPRWVVGRGDLSHVAACRQLEEACFDEPWSAAMLASELAAGSVLWMARAAGGRAAPSLESLAPIDGYALVRSTPPQAELLRLGVHPRARRRGAASAILDAALDELRHGSVEELFLEVRSDNGPARQFYEACGFEPVAERRGYYTDGCDALVLRRLLRSGRSGAVRSRAWRR